MQLAGSEGAHISRCGTGGNTPGKECGYQIRAYFLSSAALAAGWEVVPHPSAVSRDEGMAVAECVAAFEKVPQQQPSGLTQPDPHILLSANRRSIATSSALQSSTR